MKNMTGTRAPMNIMTVEEQAKQMAYIEAYKAEKKATQARLYRMMLEEEQLQYQQQQALSQELERRQALRQKRQEAQARKEIRDAPIREKIIKTALTNLIATFTQRIRDISDYYHLRDEKATKKYLDEVDTKPYKQDIKELINSNLEAMRPNIGKELFSRFQSFLQ